MAEPASPEEEWDKDTDEINSLDSEELHETRPNRWKGAPSTWRLLTEQDRSVYAALQRERDRDLSIHLYNAFALKRKRRSGPEVGSEDEDEQDEHDWMPGKNWTAWPLPPGQVPDANLVVQKGGDDEAFTVRNSAPSRPGALLEDAIAATMLRMAKERFRRRKHADGENEENEGDDDHAELEPISSSAGVKGEHSTDRDDTSRRAKKAPCPSYQAVPSADDDLSYRLLRPAARRIMERVDVTLAVLHNTRAAAAAAYQSHSSDDGEQIGPEGSTAGAPKPKPKPTLTPTVGSSTGKTKKRGGGRPRKVHVPQAGETEHEMLVRVAREQHKRMPVVLDRDAPAAETERRRRPPCSKPIKSHPPRRPHPHVGKHQQKRIGKLGVRDWRDVVGAAALAGFPHDVVARTAQRCASLFGEHVVLHELAEMPAGHDVAASMRTTRYEPGILTPDGAGDEYGSETAEEEEEERGRRPDRHMERLRSLSRHSHSRATASSSSDDAEADADRRRSSRPPSRRRSATPGGLYHFCPHPACPRAVEGFPRRGNLVRHIRLVHGDEAAASAAAAATAREEDRAVDSADEVDGAVHVDGFLKPIVMRSGWRGADAVQRKTPKRSKKERRGRTRVRESSL